MGRQWQMIMVLASVSWGLPGGFGGPFTKLNIVFNWTFRHPDFVIRGFSLQDGGRGPQMPRNRPNRRLGRVRPGPLGSSCPARLHPRPGGQGA